jgi:tyrosinase
MGPHHNTTYNPRCLTRDFSPWLATQKLNSSVVNHALSASNFSEFDIIVQGGIQVAELDYHGGGHLSVGGDLGVVSRPPCLPNRTVTQRCITDRHTNRWETFTPHLAIHCSSSTMPTWTVYGGSGKTRVSSFP